MHISTSQQKAHKWWHDSSQWDHGRRAPLAHHRRADGDGGGMDEAEAPHSDNHHPGGRLRPQVSPEAGKAQEWGTIWEPLTWWGSNERDSHEW